MEFKAFILILLLFSTARQTQSKKILCLLGVGTETAQKWNKILLTELAAKGNALTVVTPVLWNAVTEPSIKFIHLENGLKYMQDHLEEGNAVPNMLQQSILGAVFNWYGQQMATCRGNLDSKDLSKVWNMSLKEKRSFDIIIFDVTYGIGCLLYLTDLFSDVPIVGITSSTLTAEVLNINQNSILNAAIDPFFLSDFGRAMNYWTRIYNTVLYGFDYIYRQWVVNPVLDGLWSHYKLDKDLFPSKTLNDLKKRFKVILANHHPTLHTLTSLPNNVVAVPGLHIKTYHNTTITPDLSKFKEKFVNGFVLVNLELEQLGEFNVQSALKVVRNFPKYGFIWKTDKNMNSIRNKPENLILETNLESQEILELFKANNRIKVVLTIPDILHIQECIFHGIPMITLTSTAEQGYLGQRIIEQGFAVNLQQSDLRKLAFILETMLVNNSLQKTALDLQKSFAKQQTPSLDIAIWWVEHLLANPEANDYLHAESKESFGFVARISLDVVLFFEVLLVLLFINTFLVYKQTIQNFKKLSKAKKKSVEKNELKAKKAKKEKKTKAKMS